MPKFDVTVVQVRMFRADLSLDAATPRGAEREALATLHQDGEAWRLWHEEEPVVTWVRQLNLPK